jgi:hypothetical protein
MRLSIMKWRDGWCRKTVAVEDFVVRHGTDGKPSNGATARTPLGTWSDLTSRYMISG